MTLNPNARYGGEGASEDQAHQAKDRAISAMEAEMTRLIDSEDLEPERLGDETPEHFAARRCFEVMAKECGLGLMGYIECEQPTRTGPCVRERHHEGPHQGHIRYVAYPDERVADGGSS